MNLLEPSFDATTFTKNRQRLLAHAVGQGLFDEVVAEVLPLPEPAAGANSTVERSSAGMGAIRDAGEAPA